MRNNGNWKKMRHTHNIFSNYRNLQELQIFVHTHGKIFSESFHIKVNFDCNYTSPIDLTPNEIPFGAK